MEVGVSTFKTLTGKFTGNEPLVGLDIGERTISE
jgi:hypothetical protein